jgi:hypothetical protein
LKVDSSARLEGETVVNDSLYRLSEPWKGFARRQRSPCAPAISKSLINAEKSSVYKAFFTFCIFNIISYFTIFYHKKVVKM